MGFIHTAIQASVGKGLIPEVLGEDDPALIRLSGPEPEITRRLRVIVHEDMRQLTRTVTVIEWLRELINARLSKTV